MSVIEFEAWPKTPRLFRDIVVTEKIDGTNSAIIFEPVEPGSESAAEPHVIYTQTGNFAVGAQSRKRVITPGKNTDNFGFASWVRDNADELFELLGPGRHYGEWYGKGIQRGYGLDEKRFALFNVHRHTEAAEASDGLIEVVPTLYAGPFSEEAIDTCDLGLRTEGSQAVPGYMRPEGMVTFHTASRQVYKTLLDGDEIPKSTRKGE